jgi:hypothetical protein
VTPDQEHAELEIDHEDSELAPTKADFHCRSASASGLIALAVHTSKKKEICKSVFRAIAEAYGVGTRNGKLKGALLVGFRSI